MDQSADPHKAPDTYPPAQNVTPSDVSHQGMVWSAVAVSLSRRKLSVQFDVGRRASGSSSGRISDDSLGEGSTEGEHPPAWRARLASQLKKIQQMHLSTPTLPWEVPASVSDQEESGPHSSQSADPVSFWTALDPLEQHRFRSLADERAFAGGARLMRAGERANYVIVILSGRVKICVNDGGTERIVAERGPGQLVGERAILQVSVRSATVVALEMVHALVMTTEDFALYVSAHPAVLDIVEGQIYERLTERPVRYNLRYVPLTQDGPQKGLGNRRSASLPKGHPLILHGENCTIIFTDVVAFGSPERSDEHRRIIRQEILKMTAASLRAIWSQCSFEDRGDGLLIVVPASIPTAQVLEYLFIALPMALKRHNSIYGAGARIQLRVALDVGPVTSDDLGVSGQVIINAARLLEAPALKDAVAANRANLGIIVSDFIYQSAIRHAGVLSDPGAFREVGVNVKEASLRGWMQMVDPTLPAQRRALDRHQERGRDWVRQTG